MDVSTRGTSFSFPVGTAQRVIAAQYGELKAVVEEVLDAYNRADNAVVFADAFSKHVFKLQRLVWAAEDGPQELPTRATPD